MDKLFKEDFLQAGFKEEEDPIVFYRKEIIPWEEVEENDLDFEDIPCLIFGKLGEGYAFQLYTGTHFIAINATSPEEAAEWASKIISFENTI